MNRLYIAILTLFCLTPALSTAQVYSYGYYSDDNKVDSEYKDYLFIINDGYYELNNRSTMSGGGCAQMYTESISYGFALYSSDTILLHDARAGYNMKVVVTDTTLRVLDGFEGMKKMTFTGGGKAMHTDFMVRLFMKNPDKYLLRKTSLDSILFSGNLEIDTISFVFSEGAYVNGYYKQNIGKSKLNTDSVGLHMVFIKQSYEYKDGSVLLTNGEWRRKGRYIMLKDSTLNSYFVLRLTGNNEFITEVFPFANYDLELMKVD